MKVDTKGHTILIKDTEDDMLVFLEKVSQQHTSYQDYNLILDLSHDKSVTKTKIKSFSELAKKHKSGNKSFVIVAENLDFNAIEASLLVVPTVLEAHDIIDIEEIERDLGF